MSDGGHSAGARARRASERESARLSRVGPYVLEALIAKGGMGRVYRGWDDRLRRPVAVKVLSETAISDDKAADRFRREARLWARLRHPNVVALFDCSPDGSERFYLVSELVEGGSLRAKMQPGKSQAAEVAAVLLLPVAKALGVAHQQGIVHRDVKPDNVLLDLSEGVLTPKLTDFGVAVATSDPRLTTSVNTISGSVAYMAPEQLQGAEAAPTVDIWALGVTFYELVHGRLPFTGKTIGHLVAEILNRPATLQEPLFPGPLLEFTKRCLARAPEDRFQDATSLAAELTRALELVGVSSPARELQNWYEQPDYADRAASAIADRAVEEAARTTDPHRRLELLERALALVPKHTRAVALIRSGQAMGGSLAPTRARPPPKRVLWAALGGLCCVLMAAGALLLFWGPAGGEADAEQIWPADGPTAGTDPALARVELTRSGPVAERNEILAEPATRALAAAGTDEVHAEAGTSETKPAPAPAPASRSARRRLGAARPARRRAAQVGAKVRAQPAPVTPDEGRALVAKTQREGTLELTTSPWAEVLLDGRFIGYTPKVGTLKLPAGPHEILLRNPLCTDTSIRVEVRAGESVSRHVALPLRPE